MKIAVIHQNYLIAGDPGGSRFNEMARFWAEQGHQVTVIAGTINYTTARGPEQYRGRWITPEWDGPIRVLRCYVPGTYGMGIVGRLWAFLGFMISASSAVLRIGLPDVIIASSPPLTVALPGWILSLRRTPRIPWVFEVRDLWPESAITTGVLGKGSLLARLLYGLERWACRSSDRINVLTPAFKEDIADRKLAPREKMVFVPNGADVRQFKPGPRINAARAEFGWGDKIVALYAGAHGRANALSQLVGAAVELKSRTDILIASVGDGPERASLEAQTRALGLTNLVFLGPQAKERMPELVNACDIGLAVLQDNPTFKTVYPNKVFDYMACARPTVLAIDGVARKLVCDDAGAGIFAAPEAPKELAKAISKLADDAQLRRQLGENGRRWVHENATRESLAARYLGILQELPSSRAPVAEGERERARQAGKRFLDAMLAMFFLVLFSPLLLALALLVRVTLGSPVLFRQERLGLRGRSFQIVKFRTMRKGDGTDAERLTAFGSFLRATSLDELPELWNVLKGEMSLVGPRPLHLRYRDRYTPEQFRRHETQPGITGWAQIHGRNTVAWDDKFRMDVWYVDHASLLLDMRILLLTVREVFSRKGISAQGEATMSEFMGTAPRG